MDITEGEEITEDYCLTEWDGQDLTSRWSKLEPPTGGPSRDY
jgi:SET domain-containing protein